jgi:hypothetical protein
MSGIEVVRVEDGLFRVKVRDDGGDTHHDVTVATADLERLGGPYDSPEDFVRACFAFLLGREPKESILREFDISDISRYFTEFEREIASG